MVEHRGYSVKLAIWDTAGQERFVPIIVIIWNLMIMGKNLLFRTVKEHQAVTKEVKEKKLLAGCHINKFQILMAQVLFSFV